MVCGRVSAAGAVALVGCFAVPPHGGVVQKDAIVSPSSGTAEWRVEGESRPGLWIRFEASTTPVAMRELIENLRIVLEHGTRRQVLTGTAFDSLSRAGNTHQTRYMYTPVTGVLFVTLQLRTASHSYFPDTQRIELNDDCWHLLSYSVRMPEASRVPHPPPYPRTIFLNAARSAESPLYLDVFLSGNCFRNPLPPH